jgi:hypothetical protein
MSADAASAAALEEDEDDAMDLVAAVVAETGAPLTAVLLRDERRNVERERE